MNRARTTICVALLALTSFAPAWALEPGLYLLVDPDRTVTLFNSAPDAVKWDGYQIDSEAKLLDRAGWFSFEDRIAADAGAVIAKYGVGALGMGEVPGVSDTLLAELNGAGVVTLPPGDMLSLGKPFKGTFAEIAARVGTVPGVPDVDFVFSFHDYWPGPGPRPYQLVGDIIAVPEPATGLLAVLGLAGLGIAGWRRRAV